MTRDVDSLFVPHGVVLEEARNVAQDLGLPAWAVNEQASVYISGKDDPDRRRVFDHPGLRVTAASSRHIFAMKALAARTRDIDDLHLLAGIISVDSVIVTRGLGALSTGHRSCAICARQYPARGAGRDDGCGRRCRDATGTTAGNSRRAPAG